MTREDFQRLLASPDADDRRQGVIALGAGFAGDVADLVLVGLGDADWRVRKEAVSVATALAQRMDLVPSLVDALCQGENVGLRNSALEVLGHLGKRASTVLVDALPKVSMTSRKFLVEALGDTGEFGVVPALVAAADSGDANLTAAAIDALARVGGPAAELAIRARLGAPDPFHRMAALDALDRLHARVPWSELEPLLGDRMVRRVAMRTLGRSGDPGALPYLLQGVRERPTHVVAEAACALVDLYDESDELALAVTEQLHTLDEPPRVALRGLVRDGALSTRQAAAHVLILARDAAALESVMALGAEGLLPPQALSALGTWGASAVDPLLAVSARTEGFVRATALEMAADLAADAKAAGVLDEALAGRVRAAIQSALGARDESVQRAGARSLTWWATPDDARLLVRIAENGASDIAMAAGAALEALAASAPERVAEALLHVELDGAAGSALASVVALVGGPSAFGQLTAGLSASDPAARRAAVNGLSMLGGVRSAELLAYALADEDVDVRTTAARALGKLRDEHGVPLGADALLMALAGDSPSVQAAAARAVAELGEGRAVEPLRALLRSPHGGVAVAALEALRILHDPTLGHLLVEALGHPDEEVVKQALRAIDDSDTPRALSLLRIGLEHTAWHVRSLAAQLVASRPEPERLDLLRDRLAREPDEMVQRVLARALDDQPGSGP